MIYTVPESRGVEESEVRRASMDPFEEMAGKPCYST